MDNTPIVPVQKAVNGQFEAALDTRTIHTVDVAVSGRIWHYFEIWFRNWYLYCSLCNFKDSVL